MSAMWGIHNDEPSVDLIAGKFISIGWDRVGNLRQIGDDRGTIKTLLSEQYPAGKAGSYPVQAGVLVRFAFDIEVGDIVIAPHKADSTINIGVIEGDYYFDADAPTHRHRRPVRWQRIGIPRSEFTTSALYEIGSAVTLFRVKRHDVEFRTYLETGSAEAVTAVAEAEANADDMDVAVDSATEEPNPSRLMESTADFIINMLKIDVSHRGFEHFVADLLTAMGYRTRVLPYSRDGGIDIVAHRDPLGLEPPLIKVQCKHTDRTMGRPEVQQLIGTLSAGEVGLFVSLGSYSADAQALDRTRGDLRLIGRNEIVEWILDHYDLLPAHWRSRLPLRKVFVVDRDSGFD